MADLKAQVNHFKSVMDLAMLNFNADADDDEMIDKFYRSTFTITFDDKTRNETARIKFTMSPETWDLFEQLIDVVKENTEDYE